jgi:hypothetical protein
MTLRIAPNSYTYPEGSNFCGLMHVDAFLDGEEQIGNAAGDDRTITVRAHTSGIRPSSARKTRVTAYNPADKSGS